mmetsp:Transcript_71380/g.118614  ORF Transcript_71380/g.118614 Transcript_71380/m.118614 type:complete len:318 (+) Transcript_71380:458-1411(+)
MASLAFSSIRALQTSMAGVSRVSPVSFLNAKPRMAIFLPDTVLNIELTIFVAKRFFCQSFIKITWFQYSATSGNPNERHKYTRLRISFWKQDPPKPTEAFRNFGPMRESTPIACATSETSAPVASQSADIELIDEIRWARKAFAVSLESSALQRFVVSTRAVGTQRRYTFARYSTAASPCGVCGPPTNTRSGSKRSSIAVPSARNSGFESTWKSVPEQLAAITVAIASAVLTGTVDFSTMILGDLSSLVLQTAAIWRAASSQYVRSAASPAPMPDFFVGVLTETKIMVHSRMAASMSVLKNRLRPRACSTTSCNPGS